MPSPAPAISVRVPNLQKLFAPNSVAIVGASTDEKKLGNIVLRNVIESGFKGTIFPVNPHAQAIRGIGCYQSYDDIPTTPDLAIIAIPAVFVLKSVIEIAKKGTKHIVIFSAGFKEIGADGLELEKQLAQIAKEHNLAILGPNCLGFVSTTHPINATFGQIVRQSGNLRFISQSGAIATSIFDWADYNKVGFGDFVTLGNKAVITESDVLEYWLKNPDVTDASQAKQTPDYHPVGMYLESIENGTRFIDVVQKTSLVSPVFVLKPGKSAAAASAMQSHTGALAGDDAVFDAAVAKAGAIRCADLEDLFDLSRAFAWNKAPKGKKVAIISNAGGPAVITSDAVAAAGLELAVLDHDTLEALEKHLPRASSLKNPIDVLGDALAERYKDAIEAVLKTDSIDALVIILTPQVMTQIEQTAEVIGTLAAKFKKPIVCSFMGGSLVARGEYILNQYHIPSFRFPERAVRVLAIMCQWYHWQQSQLKAQTALTGGKKQIVSTSKIEEVARPILNHAKRLKQPALDSFQMEQLLQSAGIQTPPSVSVKTHKQAYDFADTVGYPIVAKLVSPMLVHKTEVKGVITNIKNQADLEKALNQLIQTRRALSHSKNTAIQLQKQVSSGVEVIVGMKRDPQFGQVLLFGAGGQLAELLDDHSLLIAPATEDEIRELIEQSKIYPLLRGFRGGREYSVSDLVAVLRRFSELGAVVDELTEMEINPLILNASGMHAVDGKGILTHD